MELGAWQHVGTSAVSTKDAEWLTFCHEVCDTLVSSQLVRAKQEHDANGRTESQSISHEAALWIQGELKLQKLLGGVREFLRQHKSGVETMSLRSSCHSVWRPPLFGQRNCRSLDDTKRIPFLPCEISTTRAWKYLTNIKKIRCPPHNEAVVSMAFLGWHGMGGFFCSSQVVSEFLIQFVTGSNNTVGFG